MSQKQGTIGLDEASSVYDYIDGIGNRIEQVNINKNEHLRSLLSESRKDLVDMMDSSYQQAFEVERQSKKRNE